jgi:putative Mg2+ transporter-C (MgtC) family protein
MEFKSFVIGILICFILSFAVGLERQYRGRFIGLRTAILLAIGTYMFVSMSFIVGASKTDITRIAAGIVSGVSFIGAGVIIKQGNKVQGLTTAATLWCDAAIGVLCATGAYYEAIVGTVIVIVVNLLLRKLSHNFNKDVYQKLSRENYILVLSVSMDKVKGVRKQINDLLHDKSYDIVVDNFKMSKNRTSIDMEITFSVKSVQSAFIDELLEKLGNNEDINKLDVNKIDDYIDLEGDF